MVRIFIILIALLGAWSNIALPQQNPPDGRDLPDGTYQVRNINATLPDPTMGARAVEKTPDSRREIESLTWGPDMRLSQPPLNAFYPAIVEDHNGYVHIVVIDDGLGFVFYVRSTDQGNSWEEGYYPWEPPTQDAFSYVLFANGDTITMPFSGYNLFRCAYSTDAGANWSDWHQPMWYFQTSSSAQFGSIIYSFAVDARCGKVFYTTNYGVSWHDEYPELLQTLRYGGGLAATQSAIHVVEDNASQTSIYYNRLKLPDLIWSNDFVISDSLLSGSFYPKIVSWGSSNLYAVWTDYKYSPYAWTGDILGRRSTDGGQSWGPEQQLTFNHLALQKDIVARNDSLFMVYDEQIDPSIDNTEEVYFNLSTDGGLNWGEPLRLTDADCRSFAPAIAIRGNRIHVAWADARDDTAYCNHNAIYYKQGILSGSEGIDNGEITPFIPEIILEGYPNPFNSITTITVSNSIDDLPICIFDVTGRLITTLKTEKGKSCWDAKGYASGIYFARANGANSDKYIKLILLK